MGKMRLINEAAVQAAITTITECCSQGGFPLGIFADSAESAAPFIKKGYTLIAVGTDALRMAHSAKATLQAIKAG
jgi:2-keto-3-deoxy-L-rhamnonate aldolase RhmA